MRWVDECSGYDSCCTKTTEFEWLGVRAGHWQIGGAWWVGNLRTNEVRMNSLGGIACSHNTVEKVGLTFNLSVGSMERLERLRRSS